MSSSNAAQTYEAQNDQQLEALHSKIRSLRGVTTDIHDDVERQNTTLDDTNNTFTSFAGSLTHSSRQAVNAFGPGGSLRRYRLLVIVVGAMVSLWILWHIISWIRYWFGV